MTAKQYKLTFEDRPEYLHARVEGEHDSYEISRDFWAEIGSECEKRGTTKLLVEENIPEVVSFSDMYNIASDLPDLFFGISIAFVDRFADQAELNSFGELVAQNRGVRGRFFADVASAEDWLREL
jgi:hypothetical protein